jgi:hypothetical protein
VTVLEHVPLERINSEARQVHFGRLLLTLIAGLFYGLGWIAAKVFLALIWIGVAIKVGFVEGRKATHGAPG